MADPDLARLTDHLAENLRFIRHRRSLTQGQLAKLCGVPRSTVANLEAGGSNPTLSVLSRLGQALHMSLEEILSAPRGRCELLQSRPSAKRRCPLPRTWSRRLLQRSMVGWHVMPPWP